MEHSATSHSLSSRKISIKAVVTGILILVMLIPAAYVNNLVGEREARQEKVVKEVSSKWAGAQTVTGPYLSIPYIEGTGKTAVARNLILLPANLEVTGAIMPEERHRSIYKVLLYRSQLQLSGNFRIKLPENVPAANLKLAEARICMGISDFKGLEDKINMQFNNTAYTLQPGLPVATIDKAGLSAPVNLTSDAPDHSFNFSLPVKLRGSSELHFAPLAENSSFHLRSPWSSPSFDGNVLPTLSTAKEAGFNATWNFTQANLPFPVAITASAIDKGAVTFGVTMLQPADQYIKTTRCTKYAILFIGLSFALFFTIELMQKHPLHPVQYILVGLALVIFYSLLLSLSEFIPFDAAYLAVAIPTVLLITLYAKGHFNSWKIAGRFAGLLGALYGFTFILVRLEDTALLVGSIGLFVILALVMYASRRINWYGQPAASSTYSE